jgi:HEAT repeat protein
LGVRNFYRVQTDYAGGAAPREKFLEAIECLGAMGTSEAAQALALQLGFFNFQTEKNGDYDEAVILALINALGELGDKAAFDYLLYVGYLNYPDRIQASAREALNRLRW